MSIQRPQHPLQRGNGCTKRLFAFGVLMALAFGMTTLVAFIGIRRADDIKPLLEVLPWFGLSEDDNALPNDDTETDHNQEDETITAAEDSSAESEAPPAAENNDDTDSVIDEGDSSMDETPPESDDDPENDPQQAPPNEPEPEGDPEVELSYDSLPPIFHEILGISLKAYPNYSVGDTSRGISKADPYVFAKLGACGMRVDIYPFPASRLTGVPMEEELMLIYQHDFVEVDGSSAVWQILAEPYAVATDAGPGIRMDALKTRSTSTFFTQLTLINQEGRYAVIKSSINQDCTDQQNMVSALAEVTDSVTLFPQEPYCYVGSLPDSNPVNLKVGCSDPALGFDGEQSLNDEGYTDIQLGPVTWDDAATYMAEHNQTDWVAP